ncbi:M23 family metallopeptidase [Paenibacillus spongiae]|uniref:M23 family metallopeptidase n=1 Tax=Paenibacillus spongiae TaxID=2909671 RepID=A0ABY5SCZ3_9BACL|nr:M23 family metallopeptidase [Paenibacillus spongiae]UVI31400.1 M23 family metallopeptidase [Paenibacillus spongiae]
MKCTHIRRTMLIACTIGLLTSLGLGAESAHAQAPAKANTPVNRASGSASTGNSSQAFDKRRELFDQMSAISGIPWYRLAAIDQYERTITKARSKSRQQLGEWIGIYMTPSQWTGLLNPDDEDQFPLSIRWFSGAGKDGDGDGLAKRTSDSDLLYAVASHLMKFGPSEDDFSIGVWQYYHNSRAVQRIRQFSRIYAAYGQLDLFEHAFPVPVGNNYSYKGTWGTKRSWGGYRIHEGTDIFANHGVPVRSTCYGIVEVKGWNPYGGWRLGIRDLNNVYHYYGHLSGYDKNISVGTIVKPGQPIGWVGSSGYGKPGTQGKFPPHLHYGVYRDRGLIEWSFDPYPMLRQWENEERRRLKRR